MMIYDTLHSFEWFALDINKYYNKKKNGDMNLRLHFRQQSSATSNWSSGGQEGFGHVTSSQDGDPSCVKKKKEVK